MLAGIDTHKDTLAVAVIDGAGRPVVVTELANTEAGFDALEELLTAHRVARVGIEGSGNYGRGAAVRLVLAGSDEVVEVPPSLTSRERSGRPGQGRDALPASVLSDVGGTLGDRGALPRGRDRSIVAPTGRRPSGPDRRRGRQRGHPHRPRLEPRSRPPLGPPAGPSRSDGTAQALGASPDDLADELTDPLSVRQLELINASTANLGLPMSGLLLRTPTEVLRVWRSDDGSLPDAATDGLRAFYRQAPSRQLQLTLDDDPTGARRARDHLALLWADAGAALTRFDLVRPGGHIGRRVQVDWHIDLLDRVNCTAA